MSEVKFIQELDFLLTTSARYKIMYGGRGGGKTENIAIALLIWAMRKKLRIACFREFQNSIDESVYSVLKAKIYEMKVEDQFDIQNKKIICLRTGSEFIFEGLRYNIDTIKSMAFLDIIWVEEAKNVSKKSWDTLIHTIRGRPEDSHFQLGPFERGPEIWISFNPELEDDETYQRFVLNPPSEFDSKGNRFCIVKKINYTDNPFFPNDLYEEMLQVRAKSEDDWLHIYGGHTKQTLDGAIFAEELKQVLLDGRRGKVKYDPTRPVHTFWDLGHSDHTAIWFVQQVGVEYNVINYFQDRLKKLPYYLEHLQSLKYVYGKHYIPHDGDAETLASRSIKQLMLEAYPKGVIVVPRVPRKIIGINAARTIFELCNFDEENTKDGWTCLSRYCYAISEKTKRFSKDPEHNEYSHGADAFLTFAQSLKTETASKKKTKVVSIQKNVGIRGGTSWMR
jgi:phage terminase large subunit